MEPRTGLHFSHRVHAAPSFPWVAWVSVSGAVCQRSWNHRSPHRVLYREAHPLGLDLLSSVPLRLSCLHGPRILGGSSVIPPSRGSAGQRWAVGGPACRFPALRSGSMARCDQVSYQGLPDETGSSFRSWIPRVISWVTRWIACSSKGLAGKTC